MLPYQIKYQEKEIKLCGIDPGLTGFLCWLTIKSGAITEFHSSKLPYVNNMICPTDLKVLLDGREFDYLIVERSQGWTGDGGSRAFNYGMNFGIIYTIAHQWQKKQNVSDSIVFVYPQTWHAIMKVKQEKGKTKENALVRALEIMPSHRAFEDQGKIRDGLVDAFLIALAGYQSLHSGIKADAN